MPLLLLAVPIVSTLLGGLLAVRLRRFAVFLYAAGAGLLLGAAFLDLLPQALSIGHTAGLDDYRVLECALLVLLLFFAIDHALHRSGRARLHGRFGAFMLISHSFRDGLAIGAAYTSSHSAGFAVALGIAAHDLGDGMNTVLLTTGGEQPVLADYGFLLADALAPFFGGLFALWLAPSPRFTVALLVLAAAFFFQMALSDFLPAIRRGQGRHRAWLMPTVFAGAALIYVANRVLGR